MYNGSSMFLRVAAAVALCMAIAQPAVAQQLRRASIWDLKINQPVSAQPAWVEYKGYGCGSNGGPILKRIHGFESFAECPKDADGLHEVYFEYDDELEYIARAVDNPTAVDRFVGTGDSGHPIMTSARFNDAGILKALRVITDPRADYVIQGDGRLDVRGRESAYQYAALLAARWNITPATDCAPLPPAEGETAIGDTFVKQRCQHVDAAKKVRLVLESNYYRKPGQTYRDPNLPTRLTEGQFESSARLDILAVD